MPQDIIRKSPIVIVRNFIALQFCAMALYYFAGSLSYYAQIWRSLPYIDEVIPFQIAQMVFLFLVEVALIMYIFFSWQRETLSVSDGKLSHHRGVVIRHHRVVSLERIAAVTFDQNLLGRLAHYGSITARDAVGTRLMKLTYAADPSDLATRLMRHVPAPMDTEPLRLVGEAEHERLERKATFRWDLKTKSVNRALEKAAMKTVAAFMNGHGGQLLLGVGDDGSIVGLEHDIQTLARRSMDGFQTHFLNVLAAMIGNDVRQHVSIRPFVHEEKPCAVVTVASAMRPVYLADEGKEEFFVRAGNGTTALKMSDAHAYIASHFHVAQRS
ncbi:MAG TPA: RNA-binding domain-containing protein [Candidatus Paceibacterota bacterium]|nr:RNA-binding domain-containing protein [Candidatus Paceibacterota bacterium]